MTGQSENLASNGALDPKLVVQDAPAYDQARGCAGALRSAGVRCPPSTTGAARGHERTGWLAHIWRGMSQRAYRRACVCDYREPYGRRTATAGRRRLTQGDHGVTMGGYQRDPTAFTRTEADLAGRGKQAAPSASHRAAVMSESFVRDFFRTCNAARISYAVLRGYEGLPEVLGNDIDFGVSGDQLDQFLVMLRSAASAHDYQCQIVLYRQDVLRMDLVHSDDGSVIKVDVWWAFKYRGLEYIDITALLDSRSLYGDLFYVPRAEYEVALSFVKELLHMKRIRADKIDLLRTKQNARFHEPFSRFFSRPLVSRFREALNEDRLSRPLLSRTAVLHLVLSNSRIYGPMHVLRSMGECLGIRLFGKGKLKYVDICRGVQ